MSDPYSNIRRTKNRCGQIDVKSILARQILEQGYDNDSSLRGAIDGIGGVVGSGPSHTGHADAEFYFDSVNRDQSYDLSQGEITFSIAELNSNVDVQNIVEMKIGKFFFPRVTAETNAPDYYFYRRVLIQVVNAPSTQAVLFSNSNRFHFEMDVDNTNSIAVELIPIKDTFFFQTPVSSLSQLQLRFFLPQPYRNINIPKDTVRVIALPATNPAQFRIVGGDTTTLIGPIGVQPVPGVAVFINSFVSGDATLDVATNRPTGHYVTTVIDATTFEVAGLNYATLGGNTSANVVIGKNRFGFTMRFTMVKNQATNFITYTHK